MKLLLVLLTLNSIPVLACEDRTTDEDGVSLEILQEEKSRTTNRRARALKK